MLWYEGGVCQVLRGDYSHIQIDIQSNTYHAVAAFVQLLAANMLYKSNEDASVKALSKYGRHPVYG